MAGGIINDDDYLYSRRELFLEFVHLLGPYAALARLELGPPGGSLVVGAGQLALQFRARFLLLVQLLADAVGGRLQAPVIRENLQRPEPRLPSQPYRTAVAARHPLAGIHFPLSSSSSPRPPTAGASTCSHVTQVNAGRGLRWRLCYTATVFINYPAWPEPG